MLAAYGAFVALLLAASLIGQATRQLCGLRAWRWTGPAVGFAALLLIADASIKLPGGGSTSLGVVIALVVVSLVIVTRKRARVAFTAGLLTATPIVVIVGVLGSANYLINQRFGIPGVTVDDDLAAFLFWAKTLAAHHSLTGTAVAGYPLGGVALAGTLGSIPGMNVLAGYQGMLIVTPVAIGLTTLELFDESTAIVRICAATVVSLAYLIAAYVAEGAFKEPIQALLIVAIAFVLRELAESPRRRPAVVALVAILVAGMTANYSYPGLAWPLLVIGVWLVLNGIRARRTLSLSSVPGLLAQFAVGVVVFVVVALPEVVHFEAFRRAEVSTINTPGGNFADRLPWREVFGLWFSDDFRVWQSDALNLQHLLLVLAVGAFLFGLYQVWSRRELSVLALLAGTLGVALATRWNTTAYNGAKALVVLSPVAVLISVYGFVAVISNHSRPIVGPLAAVMRCRAVARTLRPMAALLGCAFGLACLWSVGLVMRSAPVGPLDHASELAAIDRRLTGARVLILGQDPFSAWQLLGTHLGYLSQYDIPSVPITFRPMRPFVPGQPADFASIKPTSLDDFEYVVTTRSAFASVPPPNWHRLMATRSYEVWERRGATAPYSLLPNQPTSAPGGVLDCKTPAGRAVSRTGGVALVRSPPVVLSRATFPNGGLVASGTLFNRRVTVPPGRWQLSLQYTSATPITVRAPGLAATLPPTLEAVGQYWAVGEIRSRARPLTLSLYVHAAPPLATRRLTVLGSIALVRADASPHLVPVRQACGRYIDWYRT